MWPDIYLRTVLFLLLLLDLSCKQTEERSIQNVIDDPLPVCVHYTHDVKSYGYCIYQNVTTLPNSMMMERHCSQADEWTTNCRQAWVISQIDILPLDELFHICGTNADCSFEVLDTKPHDDVVEQTKRCFQFAGHYSQDCVMHASQRWYFEWPSATEMSRVAKMNAPFPEQIGMYIAARVACDGVGQCDGNNNIQMECERYVELFQNKKNCPNQHRNQDSRKH